MGKFNAPVTVEKKGNPRRRLFFRIVIVGAVLALAVFAYAFYEVIIKGGSGEASRDTEAQAINASTLEALASRQTPSAEVTIAVANPTEAATDEAAADPTEAPTEAAAPNTDPSGGVQIGGFRYFSIVGEESRVRFMLNEELRGQPVRVRAETDEVAGCIYIDVANPQNTLLAPIEINLRTLETDSENRNRAIRSQILESAKDEYEFTHFVPTAITGLPTSATIGQPFTFQVTGDLKLREITNSVTFQVTVTPITETRIEGIGTAQVTREAYDLNIPSVPGVANVSNEVDLEIEFVAIEDAVCAPQ
ncbi:MAG: YceI family protein [Anaerolineae bacterium]|nr:YceI family protein [Anaerolineae bacterium]